MAGIAAARDNNGLGGRGVASRASLVGYALLRASTSSSEADAMAFQAPGIGVSNNNWGPPDGIGLRTDSTSLWRDAIDFGLAIRRGAQARFDSSSQAVGQPIPKNNPTSVASTLTVAGSGIKRIEWVDLSFSAPGHPYSGDLRIVLTSLAGTKQVLAEQHSCSGRCTPYRIWRFGIAHYLNEPADGVWKISVQDLAAVDAGAFQSWQLTLYGH